MWSHASVNTVKEQEKRDRERERIYTIIKRKQ